MAAQPLQLVVAESLPDGAGRGLLGLAARSADEARRSRGEGHAELLAGAEEKRARGLLGDGEDRRRLSEAQSVEIVQQKRGPAAHVQ